jgi:hypothetical protein
MTINIGATVQRALATAKRFGLTGRVTVTRSVSATYAPATDTPSTPVVTTYTCDGAVETIEPDEPHTGGLAAQRSRRWTLAANDCAFAPESTHTVTVGGTVQRVLSIDPIAPDGVNAVAYQIEVAL